ncbi:MAG: hypothetical protein HWD85_01215 [Flavobacteriaceae bacterium]|nr:hypothetical protein [Flavobacteriaceae bacterium]
MKSKIDEFSGIDKLVVFLNKYRMLVKEEDKIYFNNMIDYFSLLYQVEVPVEQHAVEYREATEKTINVLEKYNAKGANEKLEFLIDLINFKLEAVSNIKGLAS